MTMPSTFIVGSGPSGLSLALSLLRNGVSVRIIEKRPQYPIGQRGAFLQPRTLELYKILGLLPSAQAIGRKTQPMQIFTSPEGPKPVAEVELSENMEETPLYPLINGLVIGQDKHEAMLRDHIAREYNVHVELATEFKSFVQTDDYVDATIVKTLDGGEQVEEVVRTKFLVGTDGARSAVRKQLGLSFLGESIKETQIFVGDVKVKYGLPDDTYWRSWMNEKKVSVFFIPFETYNGCYTMMVGGTEVDMDKITTDKDTLFRLVSKTIGRDIEFEVIWSGVWTANIRMVDKFGMGRVFVGGDAGHVHPPSGGQGMNSGVQDSINLAWKMALVDKELAPLSFLQTYSDERLPVIATMLDKSSELFKASARLADAPITNPDGADRINQRFKRDFELRQLGVTYRGSPVVVDEKHGTDGARDPYRGGLDGIVKAGDRAPAALGLIDLKDKSVIALYDLFSPSRHTVLIFSCSDDSVIKEVKSVFPEGAVQTIAISAPPPSESAVAVTAADYCLVDMEGYAFTHYNVASEDKHRIFVIRPDGYIGAIVHEEEGLRNYARLVFGLL